MPFVPEGWYPMPTEDRRHEQFTPKAQPERRPVQQVRQKKRVELHSLTNPLRKPRTPKLKAAVTEGQRGRYLSIEQRQEIFDRLASGTSGVELAREYGVSKAAIYSIKCGRTRLEPRGHGPGRPSNGDCNVFD